ncbi:MAG: hypothetical protein GXP49_10505 [Deltaproteobacteria bacterium]|nr:hypothetical protein [Deltaproteobacteria bacterium]
MARTWFMLFLSLLCSTAGNVVLKGTMLGIASAHAGINGIDLVLFLVADPGLWGGLILYGMGFLLWIRVLAVAKVSRVYPVGASLSFLLILVASRGFFNEHYSAGSLFGVILIGAGVVLCGIEPRGKKTGSAK